MMRNKLGLAGLVAAAALLAGKGTARADDLRVATLAPEGSSWMKIMEESGAKTAQATNGRVKLKYYAGGVQGDERDVVRKMKLKNLDGAALTSIGLSLIYPGIRVMEIPFLFENEQEVDYVRNKMAPYFRKKFEEKGFILVADGDVGWVYLYSNIPISSKADLGKVKMWAWTDDMIVKALFKKMGVNGVPLGVPDVLPALQTGRIDACYSAPLAAVALQWYTKVKYSTSLPIAYSVGAYVIRKEVWDKLSKEDQEAQMKLGREMGGKLVRTIRKDNVRALAAMTKSGVKVIPTPADLAQEFQTQAKAVSSELTGKVFSKEELDMVIKFRDEYRAAHKK